MQGIYFIFLAQILQTIGGLVDIVFEPATGAPQNVQYFIAVGYVLILFSYASILTLWR